MDASTQQNECLPESVMIFGCGYVGTALAKRLLQAGVRVGVLTRNAEKAAALRALGVSEVLEANLDDTAWHTQLKGAYRAVVNCVSSAGGGLAGYEKSYVQGQRSILQWCRSSHVERYLYTSSTSVYPQDGGVVVDESADTSEAPATGQVLLRAEQLIADSADLFEFWYVFRLAGIYGPGRHYLLNLLREGTEVIPGSGDHHLNLIHLDDIVGALVKGLSGHAPSGTYNLADDHAATKQQLVNWLAEQLKVRPPRFDPELSSSRLQRRGGRMPDRIISNHKARQSFDWVPARASFREGYAHLLSLSSD